MKTRLMIAAALAALALPAASAAAQDYYGRGYDRWERQERWRVDRNDAVRIAQRYGVRIDRLNRWDRVWDIRGRDRRGARIHMQIDIRTGQVVRFDRQWDNRWDDRGRWDNDRYDRWDRRDRDRDDDDDDD